MNYANYREVQKEIRVNKLKDNFQVIRANTKLLLKNNFNYKNKIDQNKLKNHLENVLFEGVDRNHTLVTQKYRK